MKMRRKGFIMKSNSYTAGNHMQMRCERREEIKGWFD